MTTAPLPSSLLASSNANGLAKVAQMEAPIAAAFDKAVKSLHGFHKALEASGSNAGDSIRLTPENKMTLYNEFYLVASTHPLVAAEFIERLRKWSADVLVPEYKATLDAALATGDEDTIFNAVSRNFTCFSLVATVTSTIFHNTDSNAAAAHSSAALRISAPKQILFSAYREHFYDLIRPKIQAIFFKRVSDVRKQSDVSRLRELRPIADIFAHVARSTSAVLDEKATRIYQKDYVDRYLERLVEDNKAAVRDQQAANVPANEIAKWLNNRAAFEETLLQSLVAPENNLHNAIMLRYDDDVVATCTVELVRDSTHGFAASFRQGDKSEESFRSAIDLFEISARVEGKHPQCVQECVKAFRTGCTDRLCKLIAEARVPVYESSNAHADTFVKQILDEHHLLERTVQRMRNHVALIKAQAECYKYVLNSESDSHVIMRKCKRGTAAVDERKVMFCEVLAIFVDLFLSGAQVASLDQSMVRDVGVLFTYISDRDIFGEHHKLRLAKRLLLTKFKEDLELQVLEQLQRHSGKHFIHRFEGMINDVRVAGDLQRQFSESQPKLPCEFDVKVLTMAFWPEMKADDRFVPPPALLECQQTFERFHRRVNPLKELHWRAERSMATLTVAYPKGTRELVMSVHQAAVMMAVDAVAPTIDGGKGVAVREIANRCGMAVEDVLPSLASMIFAKGLQLLRRTNVAAQTVKLEEGNCFEMNPDFSLKTRKVTLPVPSNRNFVELEPGVFDPIIEASRAQTLDAAIVCIMKAQKTLTHNEIVELTIAHVLKWFSAQPRAIKKRIEDLMQRGYLRRLPDQTDIFEFIA